MLPNCSQPLHNGYHSSRDAYQQHENQNQMQQEQSYFQENEYQSLSQRININRNNKGNNNEGLEYQEQLLSSSQIPQSLNMQHFKNNQQIVQDKHNKNTNIPRSDDQSNQENIPYFCEESFSEDSNYFHHPKQKNDISNSQIHLSNTTKSQYSNINNSQIKTKSYQENNNTHEFQSNQQQFNLKDHQTYNTQTNNNKIQKKKKVLAIITLQIGDGTDEIRVYQGDKIASLAEQFCIKHQLESEWYHQIANIIQENLQSKLQEMRQQQILGQSMQSDERSTSCTSSQREEEQIDDSSRNQKLNSNVNNKMTFYQRQQNKNAMTDQFQFQQQQSLTNSTERKNSESPKFPSIPQIASQEKIKNQQQINEYQQIVQNTNKRRQQQQQPSFGQIQFFEVSSAAVQSSDVVGNHQEKEDIEQIVEGEESSEESQSGYKMITGVNSEKQSNEYSKTEQEQNLENEYQNQQITEDDFYQREWNNCLDRQFYNSKINERDYKQANKQGLIDKNRGDSQIQHQQQYRGQLDQENKEHLNKSINRNNKHNYNSNFKGQYDEEQDKQGYENNMIESTRKQGDEYSDEMFDLGKQVQLNKIEQIQQQANQDHLFQSDVNSYYQQDLKQLKNTVMQKDVNNLKTNSNSNQIDHEVTNNNLLTKMHHLARESSKSESQQQHKQLQDSYDQNDLIFPNHESSCVDDVDTNSTQAESTKRQENEAQKSYDAWMKLLNKKITNSSNHRIGHSPNKSSLTPQKVNQLLTKNQSIKQLSISTPTKNIPTNNKNNQLNKKHPENVHSQSIYSTSTDSQDVLSLSATTRVSHQQSCSTQSAQTNNPSVDSKLFNLSPRALLKGKTIQSQLTPIKNNSALIQQTTTHRTRVAVSGSKDKLVNKTPSPNKQVFNIDEIKQMQQPQTQREQLNDFIERLSEKSKEVRISQTRNNNKTISTSINGEITPRKNTNIKSKGDTEQHHILQKNKNKLDKSIPLVDLRKSQNSNVLNNSTKQVVISQQSYRQVTPNRQLKTLAEFENTYISSSLFIGAPVSSRLCVTPSKDIQNNQFNQINTKQSYKQQHLRPPNNEQLYHSSSSSVNMNIATPKKQQQQNHNIQIENYLQTPEQALFPQQHIKQTNRIKNSHKPTKVQDKLFSKRSPQSSNNFIIPSHLKVFNDMSLQRKLAQLFSSLDSNNDGIIDSIQIDISNIDAGLVVIIQNVLYEIEENLLTLNQLEFIDLLQKHDLFLELKKYYAEIDGQYCDAHDGEEEKNINQHNNTVFNKTSESSRGYDRNTQNHQKNSKVNRTNCITTDKQITTSNQFQSNKENFFIEGTTQINSNNNNYNYLSSGDCSNHKSQRLSEYKKSNQNQQFQNFPQDTQERYFTEF